MPDITDVPPEEVAADLRELRSQLDTDVPSKRLDDNLLIATWNLKAFGDVTQKWKGAPSDSPKRDLHALRCITEIVSRFDVVAIQEVKDNLKCLRHMMKLLEPSWAFLLTDTNRGDPGNDERMAFMFDTRRVKASGLACELVVLPGEKTQVSEEEVLEQFARPPYAVSFLSGAQTFILVTLHVIFGRKPADRLDELQRIAEWMADWASREEEWGHNLIALGDFNIDRADDPNYQAFTSTGLRVPPELQNQPRTIFGGTDEGKHYDQIAWFTGEGGIPMLSLRYTGNAGIFDFTKVVLTSLTRAQLQYRMSDHYPLWAEFSVRKD